MKRKFVLLLIVMIIMSSLGFRSYAAETGAEETTIITDSERADMLEKLGAVYYTEEAEDLTRTVTRGEFAKIVVKFLGYQSFVEVQHKKPYIDVPLEHEYVREIKLLKDFGIIVDDKKLEFRPNDNIRVSEAARMLAIALGYQKLGDEMVMSVLDEITGGVIRKRDDAALLDDIYAMLENCLNIELLSINYGAENTYKFNNETFITEHYDVIHKRGVVTANKYTGLDMASTSISSGNIEVDNVVYPCNVSEYNDYLGYTVDYYIKNDDEGELLYMKPTKKNTSITVNADDIDSVDGLSVKYYKDESKIKKIELSSGVDVIYNKKAYTGYGVLENVIPNEGEMMFLDNDGDGKYDAIFVTGYTFAVAASIDKEAGVIFDDISKQRIDISDEDKTVEIYNAADERISIAVVSKNSGLTIAESKNDDGDKYMAVYLSEEPIKGVINSKSEDTVSIGNTEYDCTEGFVDTIDVGKSGVFFISKNDKIFWYESSDGVPGTEEWHVGIVYRKYFDDFEEIAGVKIFTTTGEFINYNFDTKVRVKETSAYVGGKGHYVAYEAINNSDVIRYKLNSDNEISNLEIADLGTTQADGTLTFKNSDSLRRIKSGDKISSLFGVYSESFGMDDGTQIFVIPEEKNWSETKNFGNSYSFADNAEYDIEYSAYMYLEQDIPIADVLVLKTQKKETVDKHSARFFTISDIRQVLYDDEVVYEISGISIGAKQSLMCYPEDFDRFNLNEGDIIWYEKDISGFITVAEKVYNIYCEDDSDAMLKDGERHVNSISASEYGRAEVGEVIAVEGKYMLYKIYGVNGQADSTRLTTLNCTYTKVYIDDKEIKVGSVEDLVAGDKIITGLRRGITFDVVVLK